MTRHHFFDLDPSMAKATARAMRDPQKTVIITAKMVSDSVLRISIYFPLFDKSIMD